MQCGISHHAIFCFISFCIVTLLGNIVSPVGTWGDKSRMCPAYPQRVVKGN